MHVPLVTLATHIRWPKEIKAMSVSPMHLHGCSNNSRRRLIITEWVQSKRGHISVAIGITTGHHLAAAFCKCLFFGIQVFVSGGCEPFLMAPGSVTLRSIRLNLKGRSARISQEY